MEEGSRVVVCLAGLFLVLSLAGTALGQTVVETEECEKRGFSCPKQGEASYKKYCCVESSSGPVLYSCCNPYFGLIIGVSVGIPIIIMIIVGLVVAYCICHRYHSRKMRTLMAIYHRRREEENRRREVQLLAPPPYSILNNDEQGENELPVYTADDPYKTYSDTPTSGPETTTVREDNEEGSTPNSGTNLTNEEDIQATNEIEEEEGDSSTLTDSHSTTSDRALLIDNDGQQ